ncbi:bridging integrator 1b isoform 2 [Silurus meridionalis]|nr:bridging integrator 1b isoform 2 [Silurus meridionalis]
MSIKYKLGNYRSKLRSAGCHEVGINRGEVNYSPDYPAGQSDDTLEQERLILVEELKKKTTNEIISQKMSLTFSLRRKEIVEVVPMVSEVLERWPALSLPNEIGNEFKRITNVDLLSTFRSSLHQHAPQLLKLYRARQGAFGKELEDLLNKLDLQVTIRNPHILDIKQAVLKVSLCSSVKILLHCLEMSGVFVSYSHLLLLSLFYYTTYTETRIMAEISKGVNPGKLASNVQKRISRVQEKMMQKLGKADETKDIAFEEGVVNFNKQMISYSKEMSLCFFSAMHESSKQLQSCLEDIYEPDWVGKEEMDVITEETDVLWGDFHQKLVDSALISMDAYMAKFPEIKARIAKRDRKLVDFDSARHHFASIQKSKKKDEAKLAKSVFFEPLNVQPLAKIEKLLQDGLREYFERIRLLRLTLPDASRVGIYVTTFQSLAGMGEKFHKEMCKLNHNLCDIITKLVEERQTIEVAANHNVTAESESDENKPASKTHVDTSVTNGTSNIELPSGVLYKVKAIHDYAATDNDELDLKAGDIVLVLPFVSPDEQCSFEDCKYTAHEKLVKIHWKNSHARGAKRIKLDTPDEIAKWREERRRNYPTQSNIQKKIKLVEVKEKRGDVLETTQFGLYLSSDSEKEESVKEMKASISVAPKNLTSALGSLICSYGEDMTESDEELEDSPILKSALALEENKALLAANSTPNQNSAQKPKKRQTIKESKISQQVPHLQSHLKRSGLLAPDIRHERNVLLQCIRYIIHKEFFGLACKESNIVRPDVAAAVVYSFVSGNNVSVNGITT